MKILPMSPFKLPLNYQIIESCNLASIHLNNNPMKWDIINLLRNTVSDSLHKLPIIIHVLSLNIYFDLYKQTQL
jgi:hypothetical protein